uniref:TTF-type domain-containing protein n=1 Tax=Latimeria chalumnae TaxID=7897 RepID=H3B6V4_LATCH
RSWYEQYSWLEYSVALDAMFCFACRQSGHTETAFTHDGFRNWKKASVSPKTHDTAAPHKYHMESWAEFKLRKEKGSKAKAVEENRRYMQAVVESLGFTACQTTAQRAHREDEQSTNRGNFLELLHLLGNFDSVVKKKLSDGPGNAKYVHHDIQNEVVDIMANMIRKQISEEVKAAEHFALQVDECKGISKKEQISIVVRYLNNDSIHEEFLHFTPAEDLDVDSLLEKIKHTLSKCNIDKNACIGQCYDGAAVMSECNQGVQEKFRKEVPQAVHVHCYAHRLNLVLVDCVRNVQTAAEFFATIQMVYNFFSRSVVHNLFIQKQKELEPTKKPAELKKLSDTRWACQYAACWAIQKTLPAICATLTDVINQSSAHRATEARALNTLIDQSFTVNLTMMESLLRLTNTMSDHLQSPDMQLASAIDLVHLVISALRDKRNEETWEDIWSSANDLCGLAGIDIEQNQQDSQIGERRPLTTPDDYRNHCFYPVIDNLVNELNRHFSPDSCNILKGASALNPKHESFLDKQCVLPMALHYGICEDNLAAELHQVRRLLERKKQGGTCFELATMLRPYRDAFIDLYKLVCIGVTLLVSSTACERSFSCLRRLKNYLRNSSGDCRTSNLALLSINSTRTKGLNVDDVIDSFAANHNRWTVLKQKSAIQNSV